MKKIHLILLLTYLTVYASYSQGSPTCEGSNPICGDTGFTFDNTTGVPNSGANGCLVETPNPTWFYLKIESTGNLDFEISQETTAGAPIDVDFIAWGPFAAPSCGSANLNSSTVVGCSYSVAAIEYFSITNAIADQYYMLLITNYDDKAGHITLLQTNTGAAGSGATNCCALSITGGATPACVSTTLTAVSLSSSTPTFQWYFNNVLITGATGLTYNATASGTYKVIANSPSCSPQTASVNVLINPLTTVTVNNAMTCSGSLATITATPGTPGTYSYNWTVPTGATSPGNVASFNTTVVGNYSVIITDTTTMCSSTSANGVVSSAPVGGNMNLQCGPYNSAGHPGEIYIDWANVTDSNGVRLITTFNYSYSIDGGPVVTGTQTDPSSIYILTNGLPITFTLSGVGSVCVPSETITCGCPNPMINAVTNVSACSSSLVNQINFSTSDTYDSVSWTNSNPGIGLAASDTSFYIPSFTASNVTTTQTATITVELTKYGCVGNARTFTITINPPPTVTVNSPTVCSGANATITATPGTPGTYTYAWTVPTGATAPGNVASFSTAVAGNYSVVITDTTTSCSSVSVTGAVSVISLPTVTVNSSTVCSGASATVTATPASPGTYLYAWTIPTGANPPGNVPSFTTSTSGTYSVIITNTATTCSSNSASGTINVYTQPTVVVNSPTICSGDVATVIATPGTPGTYNYNWTVPTGATAPGNVATFNTTVAGNYSVIISDTTTTCVSANATGTVTVNTIPTINATPNSQTICSEQTTGILLSSAVPNTTFSWTVFESGVSGALPGNGNIISQKLTTTASAPGVAIYTITPSSNGCEGTPIDVSINVTPIPIATATAVSQAICSGDTTAINLSSNLAGTTYSWNVAQVNVSGALQGSGNIIAQTLTATATTPGEVVYSIVPTVNNCDGLPITIKITVNPLPNTIANPVTPVPICSGNTTNINLTSGVAGTTFSWSATQNGVFGATSGSGNTIAQTLTTVGFVQGSVTYTVTPTSNGCIGTPITIPITVKPTPEVFGSAGSTICSGDQTSITLSPSIPGTTFDWMVVQNGVTGAAIGSGNSINQTLVTTGTSVGTATYTVIPTFDGCSGTPITIVETVNPAPLPNIAEGIICVTQATGATIQPYTLDTELSSTYDFVWYHEGTIIPGATANTYVATQAGQYSVVATNDMTGCISDEVFANVVASFPGEILSIDQTLAFSDNGTITINVGGSGTYEYQLDNGPFQFSNIFTGVSPGLHTFFVIDTNGCTNLGPINVLIIGYPHYFTPNADGINDTWNIIGLNTQPTSINIFDRHGKFIKQISSTGTGWDGTYNGIPLPSTDYWFTVDYMESGINKTFKAHFSLKR